MFLWLRYSEYWPYRWGFEYIDSIPCRRVRPSPVLSMALNYMWG